ncbi:hypothetical protein [Streptobacillus ratti]|uniref:hypothetical protein n=1 Tax=Streptobacillus ratti TaxID=1720557 RepID=UPI000933D480|nr:hypothetical protein [Streptobacillus ratti]
MKKILLITLMSISLMSFSKNADERYRLEGAFYYAIGNKESLRGYSHYGFVSVGAMVEYEKKVSKKVDFTFGPKVSLAGGFSRSQNESNLYGRAAINLGLKGEVNYSIDNNIKVYGGVELGMGIFVSQSRIIYKKVEANVAPVYKSSLGIKLLNKYNIALFGGYEDKVITGLELGYTF